MNTGVETTGQTDQLDVTNGDIIARVIEMKREASRHVLILSRLMAQNVNETGILRKDNGDPINSDDMSKIIEATEMLRILRLPKHIDDQDSERATAVSVHNATVSVEAAIAELFGHKELAIALIEQFPEL